MKKTFILTIVLLIATSTASYGKDTLPAGLGEKLKDPKNLKAVIDSGDSRYVIVDVREGWEYKEGHIPTAINIPGGNTSKMKNPPEKDKYIIIYCEAGFRSWMAAMKMHSDGYKFVLDWGGIRKGRYSSELRWPYELKKIE
jgi:rhodanese-related sulfurtransferase